MSAQPTLIAHQVKAEARRLGFCACGLAPAAQLSAERQAEVAAWLAAGRHAAMHYLERHASLRADVGRVVEGARAVVSVALPYAAAVGWQRGAFTLARYAVGRDYHDVVRQRLGQLMAALGLELGRDGRAFCDTGPVDERYWAVRCGLGWTGRNRQLVVPGVGSYVFLGELVLTLPADAYDDPAASRCGACRRCLDACPTGALTAEGLDARRCLSYLTIEHRGPLPPGIDASMGRCVYGCDRCAEACPWNAAASLAATGRPAADPAFEPRPELLALTPADWQQLTPERYAALFRGSAVRRAKFEGLQRNVAAATAALAAADEADAPAS